MEQLSFPWVEETVKFSQTKNDNYDDFTEKFKPKLTTDDCYTPDYVFEAVKDYVFKKWNLPDDTKTVRPFWPGTDYRLHDYPEEPFVVLDNPPFSLTSQILEFYTARSIRFFLFAPALTVLQHTGKGLGFVFINNSIPYANGAKVRTAFVHNLDTKITCSGILDHAIKAPHKSLRKIKWPDNWLAASDFMNKARRIDENEEYCVNLYSSLKETGNVQRFGGGVLVADAVADDFRGMRKDEDGIPVELKDCDKETVRSLNKWEEQERKRRQPGG